MKTEDLYQMVLSKLGHIKEDEDKLSRVFILLEEMDVNGEEEEIVGVQIEDKEDYRSLVMQIADALNDGFVCFLNPETLEIEPVDCKGYYDAIEIAEQNEDMMDEYGLDFTQWDGFIRFEPFGREDLRSAMEKFAGETDDEELAKKLQDALEANKPFRKMLDVIRHANQWDVWQVFKKQEIINYVKSGLADVDMPD
ncbi:MAG: hypothetical protein LUG96_02640 [Tannerellaceae bacterium]|nr:hypothetical protein [Tannerellaceae bacterium]